MDIKREKQIISAIAKEFTQQNNTLKLSVPKDEIEQTAIDLAESVSLRLLLQSGNNNEAAYLGRRKICLALQKELGGCIKRRGIYTIWLGINKGNRAFEIVNQHLQAEIDAQKKKTTQKKHRP